MILIESGARRTFVEVGTKGRVFMKNPSMLQIAHNYEHHNCFTFYFAFA